MIESTRQYKAGQLYPQSNSNYTNYNNFTQQSKVDIGEAKLSTLENDKFDYSKDDGKISTKDKAKNFLKGIISPVTNMFKSPKNLAMGLAVIAGGGLLIAATGGAITPLMIAAGIVGGGVQIGTSAYKAATATTDEESRLAWQGMGAGTTAVVGSVAGAKSSLKAANVEGAENMGMFKATLECFKQIPNSVSKSFKAFSSGEFIANISNAFKGNKKVEENTKEKEVSAKDKAPEQETAQPKKDSNSTSDVTAEQQQAQTKPKSEKVQTQEELPKDTVESTPQEVQTQLKQETSVMTAEDVAAKTKAEFIEKTRKTMPKTEDERMAFLKEKGMDSYFAETLKDEDRFLEFLWDNSPERHELLFQEKLASFTPEQMTNFKRAKAILDSKGIEYSDYSLACTDDIITCLNEEGLAQGGVASGHASAYSYNSLLRKEGATGNEGGLWQQILDKGFEEVSPTTEVEFVTRGVSAKRWHTKNESYEFVEKLLASKKGDIITDKGYSYASYSEQVAEHFGNCYSSDDGICAMLKIKVPKGAKVSRARYSQQAEMLFPRNAQFRVLEEAKNGEILLEYILPT